ncbi:HNH endonuclease [Synechocystis sp. FACHB-383]|uniref:HNH endonuclease n=1 Tax=Synechocystis sp. FACHB-383 TaxID=2692864 RepID=UPI0016880F77|nr:HNH endonuclease [Synechocystis sp. FACHB-383]MBD2654847.1 HNH endonuclease [Synechocystis sp. FACHB-383]
MEKRPRIPIPVSVREYIFQRDNYRCCSCGLGLGETALQIDHIIPLAKGGSNDMSNLQTLCQGCNSSKGAKFDPRFRRRYG